MPGYVGCLGGDEGGALTEVAGASWLINLDSSPGTPTFTGGTHWTGIRRAEGLERVYLYFDSLGMPPPSSFSAAARLKNCAIVCSAEEQQKGLNTVDRTCGQRTINTLKRLADAGKKDQQVFREEILGPAHAIVRG